MRTQEIIKRAASAMYRQEFDMALCFLVEDLVLPLNVTDYTKEEMEEYIRAALKKIKENTE